MKSYTQTNLKNRNFSIYIACCVLVAGILISILSYQPARIIQYIVMGCTLIGGIFGLFIWRNNLEKTHGQFYFIMGSGLVIYGLAIGIFAKELKIFLNVTSFFLLLFGITEIIFSLLTLNLQEKPRLVIMSFNIAAGIIASIGALIILTLFKENAKSALLVSGIITAFLGINLLITSKRLFKI